MDDYGNRWINGWLWWWWQQWCVDGRSLWTKKLARPSRRKSLPRSILVAPQHTPAWPRAPESRNATRRGESPRQGGAAAQRSPETVPRREVRPRNRRPLRKSRLQRRGTGPNPRGTEIGPTKAPDTAWLPTAPAARKSVLDANHEPLRLTHIRNHAHGNQLQGIPWLPPNPPLPQTSLGDALLPPSSCARAQTGTRTGGTATKRDTRSR